MDPEEVKKFIAQHPKCPCPVTTCQQHGKCFECVMVHRHYGQHLPQCLQFMLKDKIIELAKVAELSIRQAQP